jgi:hypothetical protein
MDVVFRDAPTSAHGDAAHGTLDIPDPACIADYVGHTVDYEIIVSFSDLPLDDISNEGVLAKRGDPVLYGFRILESQVSAQNTSTGRLLILERVDVG